MRRQISGTALLIVALMSLFWAVLGLPVLISAYNYDFLCWYNGGTLAREARFGDLYRETAQAQVQEQVAPGLNEPRPYARPPWFALALAPLTALPLVKAYVVWVAAWLVVMLATWAWGVARFGESALLLAALFLPTNIGLCYGQDCAAMLAICCGAWVLMERRRPLASGMVLGLGLMKFHLLLLVPLGLILKRQWRMLAGFAATGAVFLAVTLAVFGVSGLEQYVYYLRYGKTEFLGHSPESMINVYSILLNFGIDSKIVHVLAAAAVLCGSIFGILRAPTWRAVSIALTGSLLITPHVFGYDAAMLLLPMWLVIENSRHQLPRWSVLALANPLTFYTTAVRAPWSAIPAALLLVFLAVLITDGSQAEAPQPEATPARAGKPVLA